MSVIFFHSEEENSGVNCLKENFEQFGSEFSFEVEKMFHWRVHFYIFIGWS